MSSGKQKGKADGTEVPMKQREKKKDKEKDKQKDNDKGMEKLKDNDLEFPQKHPRDSDSDELNDKKMKLDEVEVEVDSEADFSSIASDLGLEDFAVGVEPKPTGVAAAVAAGLRLNLKVKADSSKEVLSVMKGIAAKMLEVVMVQEVPVEFARKILEQTNCYEQLLMNVVAENERLRGKLDVFENMPTGGASAVKSARLPPPGEVPPPMGYVPSPVVEAIPSVVPHSAPKSFAGVVAGSMAADFPVVGPKPVETWSVVLHGKKGATSKEVIDKVVKEVGPTLGVRVHELRPLKSGGAVLRTPSAVEREKVAANKKFSEVGLEVSVRDKLGPKVVVQRVHPEISPDEFMEELYSWNFKSKMTPEEFRSNVRLVTGPWKPSGNAVNVVLEGSSEAMQLLLDNGRCYIKWFSFIVRPHDAVPSCYRCLSFDHMVRECKMKDGVCRYCGEVGHLASRCVNPVRCRNCAFKRLPANHLMMSASCPIYCAIVARQNARH